MKFEREKFKRLVHYIIWHGGQKEWFGATKLNKVLWFSDIRAYALTGKSITGAIYIREKHGPVPKAIMPIRSNLISEGLISVSRLGRVERFATNTKPNTSIFTANEIAIVDWWSEHIASSHTAASISAYSHDYTWSAADMGEEIPMVATFATCLRPPTDEEMCWGRGIAARLALP
ncbi:Panacea domain-containing protein [Methylobacterium fujisawaense]|uniref:Panacea domain-containing protein n=1 Tax=Methylobacterium fujisawaense TaxID=107400 RepID=UPI003CED5C4E